MNAQNRGIKFMGYWLKSTTNPIEGCIFYKTAFYQII